jgi:peptidoglycan hydrolase-like protein with peptidoglycan-binding domain
LAALARDIGRTLYFSSGYRDVERQKVLYVENCRQHPPNGNGYVARPGNSWHNGRCAVDIDDRGFWKAHMESGDMKKTVKKQSLAEYGLSLPLNLVDSARVHEWWHVQPIETIGYIGDRMRFLDPDDKLYNPKEDGFVTVKEFQEMTGLTADGVVGPKTIAKAKEVQEVINQILKKG